MFRSRPKKPSGAAKAWPPVDRLDCLLSILVREGLPHKYLRNSYSVYQFLKAYLVKAQLTSFSVLVR